MDFYFAPPRPETGSRACPASNTVITVRWSFTWDKAGWAWSWPLTFILGRTLQRVERLHDVVWDTGQLYQLAYISEVEPFLGVIHALAWAKNILWARLVFVCKAVAFFLRGWVGGVIVEQQWIWVLIVGAHGCATMTSDIISARMTESATMPSDRISATVTCVM
jgi:hypothetical protein